MFVFRYRYGIFVTDSLYFYQSTGWENGHSNRKQFGNRKRNSLGVLQERYVYMWFVFRDKFLLTVNLVQRYGTTRIPEFVSNQTSILVYVCIWSMGGTLFLCIILRGIDQRLQPVPSQFSELCSKRWFCWLDKCRPVKLSTHFFILVFLLNIFNDSNIVIIKFK